MFTVHGTRLVSKTWRGTMSEVKWLVVNTDKTFQQDLGRPHIGLQYQTVKARSLEDAITTASDEDGWIDATLDDFWEFSSFMALYPNDIQAVVEEVSE